MLGKGLLIRIFYFTRNRMNVHRALQLLKRPVGLRNTSPQGGVMPVRNAGGSHQDFELDLPPLFPPGARQIEQAKNW